MFLAEFAVFAYLQLTPHVLLVNRGNVIPPLAFGTLEAYIICH